MNFPRFKTLLAAVALLAAAHTSAHAAANVTVLRIEPFVNGTLRLQPLAATSADDDPGFELAMDVYLRNDETHRVTVESAELTVFLGGPPTVFSWGATLRLACPSNSSTGDLIAVADPIEPNRSCRLILVDDLRFEVPAPTTAELEITFGGYQRGSTDTVTIPFLMAPHSADTASGSYAFPGKARDLHGGFVWAGSGSKNGGRHRDRAETRHAYDMGLGRWDESVGDWVDTWPLDPGEPSATDENEDFLIFGLPIYSMADGVVVACDDSVADQVPGVSGNATNQITIDHGAERARYTHLKQGSANPAICMAGAAVEKGEFLAEVGNNGNSSKPHLHIDVRRGNESVPLSFEDAFVIERAAFDSHEHQEGAWTEMRAQGLPWTRNAIWPSPVLNKNSIAGPGSNGPMSVVALPSANRAVTAIRGDSGDLTLGLWYLWWHGQVDEQDSIEDGEVFQLDLARGTTGNDVVSVAQNGNGDLELVFWNVVGDSLVRQGDANGDAVELLAATSAPSLPGLVTAVRNDVGDLEVQAWEVSGLGFINPGGIDHAGAISDVAVATGDSFNGVVTAVRNGAGLLQVIAWEVSGNEAAVTRQGDATGPAIHSVDIAFAGQVGGVDRMVTAARDANDDLLITTWSVDAFGTVAELDSVTLEAGATIALNSITNVSVAEAWAGRVHTAVRAGDGVMHVMAWDVADNGDIDQLGRDSDGITTGVVDLTAAWRPSVADGRAYTVSVLRDVTGELRVTSWQLAGMP